MERWNRQVSPQERATAITKLQRFLLGLVGDGPDAVTRATDLANKFEQHVFTSTTTREDYLKVIIQRMQQAQRRSDEEGLELCEADRLVVQQKMARLQATLPMMEKLLGRCKGESELTKLYTELMEKIQKQLELLPRRVYILSVTTATNLVDQVQHYTNEIQAMLNEQSTKVVPNKIQTEEENDMGEKNLVTWLNSRRFHLEMINAPEKKRTTTMARIQVDPRSVNSKASKRLLAAEIISLCRHRPELLIRSEQHQWGFALHCRFKDQSIGIELPLDYPTERFHIVSLQGSQTETFVNILQSGEMHIFDPVSLTTLINVYIAYLEGTIGA